MAGRRQDGRAQSYFSLKADIHGDLEFRHRNCLDFRPLMPNAVSRKRIRRIFGRPSTKSRLVTFVHEIFSLVKSVLLCLIMGFEEMAESSGKASARSQSPGSESWLCPHQLRGTGWWASVCLYGDGELPRKSYLCCRAAVRTRLLMHVKNPALFFYSDIS